MTFSRSNMLICGLWIVDCETTLHHIYYITDHHSWMAWKNGDRRGQYSTNKNQLSTRCPSYSILMLGRNIVKRSAKSRVKVDEVFEASALIAAKSRNATS